MHAAEDYRKSQLTSDTDSFYPSPPKGVSSMKPLRLTLPICAIGLLVSSATAIARMRTRKN